MKTSAQLQQQSFFRKLFYFGLILVLFTVMTFSSRFAQVIAQAKPFKGAENLPFLTVTGKARSLQLNESEQGEADLGGSTIRLALSGARGFAITFVWLMAIDNQKKHEWNQVDLLVNAITKLQPHFLTPWLFQSWNLAYNVSVESDRVADKYYYISRGIELLAQGERVNRGHGMDENGQEFEVGNPDMRYWIGFYYQNKFGVSDEQHTLRCLLQLSCINPDKRRPETFRLPNGGIDKQKFLEFLKENPMLCRRLRDHLRCREPVDVVDFLADNVKLFGRYEEGDHGWQLKTRPESQFPVLPIAPATEALASPYREFAGNFDSFHCAWAWHLYAQDPLPPVEYGRAAGAAPQDFDHLRYRLGRQPAPIIFRQGPPRSTSYIADRLQKEGWFDDSGWTVDEDSQSNPWFPDQVVVVGNDRRYSSQVEWQAAHEQWAEHGKKHGFLPSEAEQQNLIAASKLFRDTYNVQIGFRGPDLQRDQVSEEMWLSYEAELQLFNRQLNENMTNFPHFYYEAEAESDNRTVRARRLLFQADRLRHSASPSRAIQAYEEAFTLLVGNKAEAKIGLLENFQKFREDGVVQEDLVEKQYDYLGLLEIERGPKMRNLYALTNAIAAGAFMPNVDSVFASVLYDDANRSNNVYTLPKLFVGPMDGTDSKDEPWVTEDNVQRVRTRRGIRSAPPASQKRVASPGPEQK
jgi:hypothetical protein